jgi:hypothetical protein
VTLVFQQKVVVGKLKQYVVGIVKIRFAALDAFSQKSFGYPTESGARFIGVGVDHFDHALLVISKDRLVFLPLE